MQPDIFCFWQGWRTQEMEIAVDHPDQAGLAMLCYYQTMHQS